MNQFRKAEEAGLPAGEAVSPEAPAAVVAACHRQIHLMLGLAFLFGSLAVSGLMLGIQLVQLNGLIAQVPGYQGENPGPLAGPGVLGLALLAAANAVSLLRYRAALRRFHADRRIIVLHQAMCRMRTMWAFFALALSAGAGAMSVVMFSRL